ncbi:hypothetical protein KEM55_002299 [Ascosphaera atra]|nr:hypothetical protein KEM55_002299 [Ascosphaera atra]
MDIEVEGRKYHKTENFVTDLLGGPKEEVAQRLHRHFVKLNIVDRQRKVINLWTSLAVEKSKEKGIIDEEEYNQYRQKGFTRDDKKNGVAAMLRHQNQVKACWGMAALQLLDLSLNHGQSVPASWRPFPKLVEVTVTPIPAEVAAPA